jgi:hypothetical protein
VREELDGCCKREREIKTEGREEKRETSDV